MLCCSNLEYYATPVFSRVCCISTYTLYLFLYVLHLIFYTDSYIHSLPLSFSLTLSLHYSFVFSSSCCSLHLSFSLMLSLHCHFAAFFSSCCILLLGFGLTLSLHCHFAFFSSHCTLLLSFDLAFLHHRELRFFFLGLLLLL